MLLLVSLGMWALASPVGASPDEDFHLTSSWCGQGIRDGTCEASAQASERLIPQALLGAPCFAFQPEQSAACQGTRITDPGDAMVSTTRGNFTGDYPPLFFAFTGLFVGDDIGGSVLAMRLANALIFVLMTGATFWLAPPALRRTLVAGIAVTIIPLGVFIVPSINPSSWAVTSAATVFLAVVIHMTAESRRRIALSGILSAVAVSIGAGARADSALYAALAVGAALVVTFRPTREGLLRMIFPGLLAVAAALAFLNTGQSSAVSGTSPQALSVSRLVQLLTDVPELWVGALGKWGLGWLDTTMPPIIWTVMLALFAAAILSGVRGLGRKQALAAAGVALATWLVPAYIQYLTGVPVGAYVQPRYILPLLILLVLTVLCRVTGTGLRLSPAQRWLAVIGVGGANALALYINLRRYVSGTDVVAANLDFGREWWWPDALLTPTGVWLVGGAAFLSALILLSRDLVDGADRHDSMAHRLEAAVPEGTKEPRG